jgi:Fe-S cluster biogenesis protein NfuA
MTAALASQVDALNLKLRAHAGGIEVRDLSAEGRLRIRYTGMCTGCPFRMITTEATVRPALLGVEGVAGLEVEGMRISEEAQLRLTAALAR